MYTSYDTIAKVVLLGSSGCGKSSLMTVYDNEPFNQDSLSTIGVDFKMKYEKRNGQTVLVQINDTAGQERFNSITVSYLRGASGVLLVFDLTDEVSFYNCEKWKESIIKMAPPNTPIILIGNKSDLKCRRVIQYSQATEMASQLGAEQYWETSAKTAENVVEVFSAALDLILSKQTYTKLNNDEPQKKIYFNINDPRQQEPSRSFLKRTFNSLGCNFL